MTRVILEPAVLLIEFSCEIYYTLLNPVVTLWKKNQFFKYLFAQTRIRNSSLVFKFTQFVFTIRNELKFMRRIKCQCHIGVW